MKKPSKKLRNIHRNNMNKLKTCTKSNFRVKKKNSKKEIYEHIGSCIKEINSKFDEMIRQVRRGRTKKKTTQILETKPKFAEKNR